MGCRQGAGTLDRRAHSRLNRRVPAKKPSFISGVKSPPWKMVAPDSPQEELYPTGERGRLLLTHVPVMSAPFLPFTALHMPSSLVKVTSSLLFLAHGISDTKGQGGTSLSLEPKSFPFHLFSDILASALQASWKLLSRWPRSRWTLPVLSFPGPTHQPVKLSC